MRNSRGARLSGGGRRVDLLHGLEPRVLLCGQIHDGTMAVTFWSTDGSDDPLASYTVPTGASAFERTTWSVGPLVGPGSLLIKPKAVPAAVGPAARNALMSWVGVGTPQGPRLTPWTSGTVATSGAQSSSASPAGAAPVGAAPAPALDSPTDGGPAGSTYTLAASGLPLLHSNPTAPSMIFLDFDGDSTSSTNPYSEDADTATFNATEQASIISAWRQASAYWAMFNIDVSTEQPPAGMYRAWNAIGNNISGGYAYLNNFNTQQRAWGFNQSSNARDRVSGIVHEGGHIFNLQHQSAYDRWGTKTAEYLSAPDTLHGPLMGVDYSGSVHKWFIGHPANSVTGVQDDLAVISAKIKAREVAAGNAAADGYRPDDFAGTIGAGASVMTSSGASWEAAGIIERMSDVDVFSFVSDGGAYEISATPPAPSGADLKLDVYAANGTRLASDDDANNGQQLSLDLPAGTYYAAVASHGNYGDLGMYEVAARPLLPGSAWVSADVAPTTVWGYGEFDPSTGVFTNAGSGADVWGTSDSFHFTYQAIAGDATIVARVLSMENTSSTAKAGIDIRASLAANSQHAYVADSYGSGRVFGYRTTAGGSTSSVGGTTTAFAPYWLKLVRSGNTFTGSRSTDGVTWTTIGSQTITMGSTVYVGLMTTAVGSTKLNAATFDNVTVTGTAAGSVTNALPAPAGVTVVRPATGSGLTVNWSAVPGATGYTVERSDDGVTFAPVGTTVGNAVTTLTNSPTLGSMRYFFRVRASDATGASTPSAVIDAVNRPTAVTGLGTISVNTTTIKVYWKDTHGETGYRLERSADAGATWTTVQAALGTNVPMYTDSGLTVNTTYQYRVTPLSSLGDGVQATVTETTRLPTVTGLAVDSVAPTTGTFHWTAVAGATGYRIDRSTDNSSWTTGVGTTAAGVTSYTATGLTELTHYYFRVVGTAGTTISLYHGNFFLATPDATPPAQWTSADIGAVGGPGAAGANTSNVFSVIGSGADIWGTADAMRYLYQPLVGDGEIVARVASVENTDDWVKAGVMIRESTAAGARNAFMLISRASGAQWQYRSSTGGSSSSVNSAGKAAPYWVKLGRVGNVFTGSVSTDGSAWTVIGTQTITMGASALVGLATTAHNNAEIAKATFDNVTLSNAAPTIATNPAASPATVTGTTTALSVLAADDHGEANLTYAWTVTAAPAGATGAAAPTFSANGTNAAKAATATFYRAGAYTLTLTATDAGGLTVSRTVNVTVSQTLTAITVTPASGAQAAANGGAVQFAAAAVDQFGQPMARTFTWSVTGTGNAVSSSGLFTAGPNAGSYTVTATSGSVSGSAGVTVTAPVVAATVAGRRVFYNNSAYDGGSADPGVADDGAVAPDKQALLPGQASSSANFTNYDKGINGIMIDVAGLPAGAGPTAADFAFLAGVTADPAAWTEVVTPATVAVRRGAGAGGSDRVTVTFADRTLVDRWLRVTVLANAITGLAAADVFYVGNLVADTGNGAVTISDVNQTKFAMVTGDPVTITTPTDWNRNGVLTISDVNIARANVSHTLVALTAPAGAAPDAAAATDLAVAVDRPPAPVVFATARRITGVWDD